MAAPSDITFLMIGCQRSGTTWTDAALREHPEVYLPATKQSYFFDRNYHEGHEWYLSRFEEVDDRHKAVGEVATGYSTLEAIPRMAHDLPHVKLFMTMRHPIDRAHSYYISRRATHGWRSMEQALDERPDLLTRGEYIDQVEALLKHYPPERLLLLFYDDFSRDDRAYLRSILEFLDVDPNFESSQFGRMRNSAMFPRLRAALNRVGLRPVLRVVSRSPIGDAIRGAKKRSGAKAYDQMDPSLRARLVDHFRPYNDRLAAFCDRDLSDWNR